MQEAKRSEREKKSNKRGLQRPILKRETITQCGKAALFFGVGFLLGRAALPFETYPLGLAFLCAAQVWLPAIFAGLLAAALTQQTFPVALICVCGAVLFANWLIRLLYDAPKDGSLRRPRKDARLSYASALQPEKEGKAGRLKAFFAAWFSPALKLRIALAGASALVLALLRIIAGGFRYYDFFAALLLVFVTPLAAALYGVALGGESSEKVFLLVAREVLLFSLVYGAKTLDLPGFSIAVSLGLFSSVYVLRKRGLAAGALSASVAGIAYGIAYAPAFLIFLLLFAFCSEPKKSTLGISLALAGFSAWAYFAGGWWGLLRLFPSGLAALAALQVEERLRTQEEKEEDDACNERRVPIEGERRKDANDRFRSISEAFSSLSEVFYNLSDRFRRPGTLDLRQICDRSFDHFCPDCPNKTVCWGLEYSDTLVTVNALISALHTKGKVTENEIPEAFFRRCGCMDEILQYMNRECAKLTGELLSNNRTEIFAMDYESAADIIKDALEEDDGEYRFDPELEKKVADYLSDAGILCTSVTVYGNRRRQILLRGIDLDRSKVTLETLRSDLGDLCGVSFSTPVLELEKKVRSLTLQSCVQLSVTGAFYNLSAEGGVSGDAVNLFANKKEYYYALISDGMGCGREAALTSNLCSIFLEKMLRAGNRAGTSLKMLNNMLGSRASDSTRECSSTVDLVEIDLVLSQAVFMKSGAAPSFVVRGGEVNRLQAGTAPIGIIRTLDVGSETFRLRPGDTIVLISDGILEHDPECLWISSYLEGVSDRTPEEIAYHICHHAASYEHHDDCSALALRIGKKE